MSQVNPTIVQSARLLALGTLTSRIAGFLRDLLLAALFDRTVTDCFVVAFRLPNFFRRIFGEGAISSVLMPLLIATYHQQRPTPRSKKLINSLLSVFAIVLLVLSLAGVIWMPRILHSLVGHPGFGSIPGKLDLAIWMARWMFPLLWFVCIYSFCATLLQSLGHFAAAAFAPLGFNLTLVTCFLVMDSDSGKWVGLAVLAASMVQLAVLIPSLTRAHLTPTFRLRGLGPEVLHFFRSLVPSAASLGALQIIGVLNVFFASLLAEGSHSYLYWVDRLLELPMSLVGVSLASALLPALSHAKKSHPDQLSILLLASLRSALFWVLPFVIGIWVLPRATTELVYMRGKFNWQDARQTASLLQIGGITLLSGTLIKVRNAAVFALRKPRIAALIAMSAVLLHALVGSAAVYRLGLEGLAWTTAFSTSAHLLGLFIYIQCYGPRLRLRTLSEMTGKMGFGAVLMGMVYTFEPQLQALLIETLPRLAPALSFVLVAVSGFVVFYGVCRLLRVPVFAMMTTR